MTRTPPDQRDRLAARRANPPKPNPVAQQIAEKRRRCQRVAFLTGSSVPWLDWNARTGGAHGWTLAFCADPNPAYAQHLTSAAVAVARAAGFNVASWCGLLGMEHSGFDGPGARFAKKACEDFGLDWWYGQFETPEEWDDCMEHGATLGIGNPNAITRDAFIEGEFVPGQQSQLRERLALGTFAYTAECYSNIPNWPMPSAYGAPQGCPPASLCAGAGDFDGGHLPLKNWIADAWMEHKSTLCIYDAGMSPADFEALP